MTEDLNENILGQISTTAIEAIIQDATANIGSAKIFKLCHAWSKCEPLDPDETKDDRIRTAKALVREFVPVELEFIDPDDPQILLASSDLVAKDQATNALLKQAKRAKHEHTLSFHKPNFDVGATAWTNAKSKTFYVKHFQWKSDSMQGSPLFVLGRKYQWTVNTVTDPTDEDPSNAHGTGVWLGVTKSGYALIKMKESVVVRKAVGVFTAIMEPNGQMVQRIMVDYSGKLPNFGKHRSP